MVRAGELGDVQLVASWFNFYLPADQPRNIRLRADVSGGSLWDVGVYPNSMSIVMAGADAPEEVWASQIVGESGVDVAMRAQLRFRGDAVAQISSGFRTPFREGTHIVGDRGIIQIAEPWKPGTAGDTEVIFIDRSGKSRVLSFPAVDPYLCEVQTMEACVLDGADPVVPLSLSREFLRSALAIHASAASGRPVRP
jgi:predicted dehydrogenase